MTARTKRRKTKNRDDDRSSTARCPWKRTRKQKVVRNKRLREREESNKSNATQPGRSPRRDPSGSISFRNPITNQKTELLRRLEGNRISNARKHTFTFLMATRHLQLHLNDGNYSIADFYRAEHVHEKWRTN